MIERYSLPAMVRLWSDETKYALWARIESLVAEAQARSGMIPAEAFEVIRSTPAPAVEAVRRNEKLRDHEILAFLAAYTEAMPAGTARWVHHGLTSYDVVDTGLGHTLAASCDLLLIEGRRLLTALAGQAVQHWDTICIGRTHGVHAEPTTWGQKMALFAFAVERSLRRLAAARTSVAVGTVSGPVGTYADLPPAVEEHVCGALGLTVEPIPSQVVARDRHAELLSAIAVGGAVVEQIGLEFRLLQRTEVAEVEEPRTVAYQGSSAMPHKRNPSTSERLVGLARLLRANAAAALEDVALWHERDLTHQSTERVILPDSLTVAHFQMSTAAGLIEQARVDTERMRENIGTTRGLIYSSLAYRDMVTAGTDREVAHRLAQSAAKQASANGQQFAHALKEAGVEVVASGFRPERFLTNREHLRRRLNTLIEESELDVAH
ncbi:adenylosuccinate lyase [Micromonospora sp. WMMD964]|uniref:adenylosuccinate lyase n=1 Tax=Micromonospora sp. WMMD964 TaxID=3016091 RepID=UPI00249B0E72|nr:adenylosuccinate lyase [Micromonospora sp. WMMD964]WFE98639.1 adenylosuccinate lyase [Micromonospora sp. WMMD964]